MRTMLKNAIREESGKILILVLVLLVVGGLLLTPLLGLMSTGLVAGQVYERKTAELYAADAGVEDAVWHLKPRDPDPTRVPVTLGETVSYRLGERVNEKLVDITTLMVSGPIGAGTYEITSIAGLCESRTTVVSRILTFPSFWSNAITSTGKVTLRNADVIGNVMADPLALEGAHSDIREGRFVGPYPDKWPGSDPGYEAFRAFYRQQVEGKRLAADCDKLQFSNQGGEMYSIEGGFHEGNLLIESSEGVTRAKLIDTVYIKGDNAQLEIKQGNTKWELDLNGQTIYVEGKSYGLKSNGSALMIGNNVDITGSGVIIAEGNISFKPNLEAGTDKDFVFVLSLLGRVSFQPNGTFYGSVAGLEVSVQPARPGQDEVTIEHTDPGVDPATQEIMLNFFYEATDRAVKILTWEIK